MSSDLLPPFPDPTPLTSTAATTSAATAKRQRRPSVRLGDIGEPNPNPNPSRKQLPLKLPPRSNPNPNRSRSRRAPRVRSTWTSASRRDEYEEEEEEEDEEGLRDEFEQSREREESPTPSHRYQFDKRDDQNGSLGMEEVGEEEDDSEGGVLSWLNRLGLGRYAPVFEIHEVDDEVLPLLTLEDLKDMGINAVGSRRKMFSSIQKLKKKKDL